MLTAIFSFFSSTVGQIIAIAAVCFLAGVLVCWHFCHRLRTFDDSFEVVEVENGATIDVAVGLLKRKSRPVMIAGISAPGLNDPCGPESKANLEKLAGSTIRLQTSEREGLGGKKALVGDAFGATGVDLGLAQLRAGLAVCETAAGKEQLAAQAEAKRKGLGLWSSQNAGSRWWHFSMGSVSFPDAIEEPIPVETSTVQEIPMLSTIGTLLIVFVVIAAIAWAIVAMFGTSLSSSTVGKAVISAVDTTEEVSAYAALTSIRYMEPVVADPQAVTACEYLLKATLTWPATPKATAATAKTKPALNLVP
jgi:endonuclease YncB( thermonuclease family)